MYEKNCKRSGSYNFHALTSFQIMYLHQKYIFDIISLSKEDEYKDVTIFCKNGTFQANSLILSAIFPVINNALCPVFKEDKPCMISIPELETMELEILFNTIHQQSPTIEFGPVLQDLLEPSFKTEPFHIISDNATVILKIEKSSEPQNQNEIDPLGHKDEIDFKDEKLTVNEMMNYDVDSSQQILNHEPKDEKRIESGKEKTAVCMYCGKVYENHTRLRNHVSRYHDVTVFKCDICFKECKGKKSMEDHMRTHNQLQCNGCHQYFKEKSFKSHQLRCLIVPPLEEIIKIECPMEQTLGLKRHMNTHVSLKDPEVTREKKYYQCNLCQYKTERSNNIKKHMAVHRKPKVIRETKCDDCGIDFTRHHGWKRHREGGCKKSKVIMLDSEEGKGKKFKCKECDYISDMPADVRRHYDTVHSKDCSFPCQYCGNIFYSRIALSSHIKRMHEIPEGHTKCKKCRKIIPETDLSNHECEKFVCNVCGNVFYSLSNLQSHKMVHELPEEKHFCNICGKGFPVMNRLSSHMKNVHSEKLPCPHCDKYFAVKYLETHIKLVHDPTSLEFKCEICGRGFNHKVHLDKHTMNVHLKLQPYKCRYGCDIGYNDISNRNSHEKKKHGKLFTTEKEEKIKAILALKG